MSDEKKEPTHLAAVPTAETAEKQTEALTKEMQEAQAAIAVTQAIGEQLRLLANAPGVNQLLVGLGTMLEKKVDLQLEQQKQAHELRMAQEKNQADALRRRELIGVFAGSFILTIGVASVFGLIGLVHNGYLDTKDAMTLGIVMTTVLGALGWRRAPTPAAPAAH